MPQKYIVRKPFGGPGGKTFTSGEVVELDGRNVASLVSLRFIEPHFPDTAIEASNTAKPRAQVKQKD